MERDIQLVRDLVAASPGFEGLFDAHVVNEEVQFEASHHVVGGGGPCGADAFGSVAARCMDRA
ncbi:hypothetical protein DEJ50_23420 [Streptomyces venezuelae]|uniref:Uncharacterized protein n=1 Tax=Streptomyces venezuelae TaxID=54571 RepID=A0A5P2D6Z2_STRVZ|nr:hypothetical protein DEJ50_23420 [Streptomyces venezuelae]